jgi:hypothetical protein
MKKESTLKIYKGPEGYYYGYSAESPNDDVYDDNVSSDSVFDSVRKLNENLKNMKQKRTRRKVNRQSKGGVNH